MKHFYFLLICLSGFIFTFRIQAQVKVIDEVVMVIGDEAIFLSDVESMRELMQFEGHQIKGDPYCYIIEQLAIQKLYLHQAKLDSIEITDSQVYNELDFQISEAIRRAGSQEKLEEYTNKSLNALREEYRTRLKEYYTVGQMKNKLLKDLKVTNTEVRTFFNRIPADSLPFIPTTVEVQIISLEPKVSIEEIDKIKQQLRDFTEQITTGKTQFSTLAIAYSDDEETRVRGGVKGMIGKAHLLPEFAAVAFDLNDPNRVSNIVETEYGFHIIQLIEKRGDRINFRHILRRPFVSKEDIEKALLSLDSIRNNIIEDKYSFEEAALYISSDKSTKNNRGLMVNTPNVNMPVHSIRTGTSRFEMSELPAEISKKIVEMQVGEISKPFSMINVKTNKEMVAIVKLKSRTEGHKASLSADYQELKLMVEAEKEEEIKNKWLAKKQKETYIKISDKWKNCDFERDGWLK